MSRERIPRTSEGGFALVGVVMFVLVLTILGLSLFSLTGYEAQFMQQSMDGADAFQAAAGGLDRARFALARMSVLASVKNSLPLDGVVYAVARQGTDTTNAVNWDSNAPDILIRVKAQKNGQTRFLEAKFDPGRPRSLYRRLMSLSGVDPDSSALHVIRQDPTERGEWNYWATWLYGEAQQNEDNTPERIFPFGFPPQSLTLSLPPFGGVPAPDVDGFFAQHWLSATEAKETGQNNYSLDALASPDSVRFFRTARTSGNWSFDFVLRSPQWNRWDPRITVSGTAIWMFDYGIRSEGTIYVSGSGGRNDVLVLVAKPSTDPGNYNPDEDYAYDFNARRSMRGAGIALLGSIQANIPVILISSGGVLLENRDYNYGGNGDDKTSTTVNCLTVFARYARVLGPDSDMGTNPNQGGPSGARMTFAHSDTDPANQRIERLVDLGVLPNTSGGLKGKLRFLAGSWREVTETSPP